MISLKIFYDEKHFTSKQTEHKLGLFLQVQARPFSYRGALLLTWKTDIKLTCFYVSNDIIYVWCYSIGFSYCPMDDLFYLWSSLLEK